MAALLYGKVYYKDQFAGILQQEPGDRYSFSYDESYLSSSNPAISHTLPLSDKPFVSEAYLPAFFDNLVAEGWLENAQRRLLGKRGGSRFELLLAFGHDCAGAVSIIDPTLQPLAENVVDKTDMRTVAVFKNRASLSGIQPKMLMRMEKGKLIPAVNGELSTHIAKLPSDSIFDITYNEWLTLCACKALLPEDDFVEANMQTIDGVAEEALIIKRFDRTSEGEKIHFEEFNQLLNLQTFQKYDGAYQDMAKFIAEENDCIPSDVYRLFKRVIVGLLTGNTDMHFKNFAMMHTQDGLRLAQNYDQVAAAIYKPYQYVALVIDGAADRVIGQLKPKTIIALAQEFGLSDEALMLAINEIGRRLSDAKDTVNEANISQILMKEKIIKFMEKRWNGTFALIGQLLSKKQ